MAREDSGNLGHTHCSMWMSVKHPTDSANQFRSCGNSGRMRVADVVAVVVSRRVRRVSSD